MPTPETIPATNPTQKVIWSLCICTSKLKNFYPILVHPIGEIKHDLNRALLVSLHIFCNLPNFRKHLTVNRNRSSFSHCFFHRFNPICYRFFTDFSVKEISLVPEESCTADDNVFSVCRYQTFYESFYHEPDGSAMIFPQKSLREPLKIPYRA